MLCLHLEKQNLLKILPANSGSKMIYLHISHVEMSTLLLLPVSIKNLNIIDALCFKYIENNIESVVVFPLPDNS